MVTRYVRNLKMIAMSFSKHIRKFENEFQSRVGVRNTSMVKVLPCMDCLADEPAFMVTSYNVGLATEGILTQSQSKACVFLRIIVKYPVR